LSYVSWSTPNFPDSKLKGRTPPVQVAVASGT